MFDRFYNLLLYYNKILISSLSNVFVANLSYNFYKQYDLTYNFSVKWMEMILNDKGKVIIK